MKVGEYHLKDNIMTTKKLRKMNKEKIIQALYDLGECNKNQLAKYTNLSQGTCYNILQELLDSKEIIMGEGFDSTGGRKAKSYKLNKDYSKTLAISFHRQYDIVVYKIRVYNYVDELIYEELSQPSMIELETLCQDIQRIIDLFNHIKVLALSIPAIITQEGSIEDITLVKGLEKLAHIPIQEELYKRFNKQVIIENDVNTAVIGYYNQHKDISNIGFVYQPMDDLAGLAFIVNGVLLSGQHGLVGEMPFLPFMKQQEQYEYLKTSTGIYQILSQMITLMMIMNDPQHIVVCCQDINHDLLYQNILKYIPYENLISEIIIVDNIESLIFQGLLLMSKERLTKI